MEPQIELTITLKVVLPRSVVPDFKEALMGLVYFADNDYVFTHEDEQEV